MTRHDIVEHFEHFAAALRYNKPGDDDIRAVYPQSAEKIVLTVEDLEQACAEIRRLRTALDNTLVLAEIKWGNLDPDALAVFNSARGILGKQPLPERG